ncbi:Ctr-domain-containing protein [Phaeosphaeriaceae sp. SRC1lsM3a]|nr:Ctr-domain-containing protein [Stagonospora sp. SRC1lsM3a]
MSMDHGGMMMSSASKAMSGMAPTGTGMSMPTSSAAGGMGGMGGMSMGGGCKISMLWNWNTVDACFIAKSWRIRSQGAFAGSCIGVILLVIALEFLRRAGKEYDRYIVAQHIKTLASAGPSSSSASSADGGATKNTTTATALPIAAAAPRFRPSILQQAVRALLHMLQFAVAYFVMLLAMYYNGYIIICIFIGAYIGYFIFGYESFSVAQGGRDRMEPNATVCCG